MNSFHASIFSDLRLGAHETRSIKVIEQCRGRQDQFLKQSPEALEVLRNAAMIESTESSNRLEGIVTTGERLKALMLKTTKPRNRDEEEIAGYRDALVYIHQNPRAISFDVPGILRLHRMIYRHPSEPAGAWKKKDNVILERGANGQAFVRFKPTSAKGTPGAMRQLVLEFQKATQDRAEPLVILPLAILDLLCIHPFADGNGRVSRLMTLILAYQFGYEVGRYVSLERIIEQSKDRYYENLKLSSQGWHERAHHVHPFLNYLLFVLATAYQEFEQRVQAVKEGKGSKSQLVENVIMMQMTPFNLAEIQAKCPGISRDQIKLVMRKLKAEGKIKSLGRGRDARWARTSQ